MTQFADEQSQDGEFERQEDSFRDFVSRDADAPFPVEPDRYHLYISLACPWAHRTLIVRRLLGLEQTVGVTIADPLRDERGWNFLDENGGSRDAVNGFTYLAEAYQISAPGCHGRVTVPVLWDKKTRRIVNNSEDDICRMFAGVFTTPAETGIDLFPASIAKEQAELSSLIYETVNNGVYRAGFASRQAPYERAVVKLFKTLDELESRLAHSRYLFGSHFVETDWRLFCTLIRFDAVYHGHFKCNIRRIIDYPNLFGFLRDLYQQPGIAGTVNFDHIKRHYYITHEDINPTRIVPVGPDLSALDRPADRQDL